MAMIKIFLMAFIIFIITDMIWLGFIAKNMYFQHYSPWLRLTQNQLQPIWWSAIAVYLLFATSIVFIILPLAQESILRAATYGALLGFIIYGVYDFTCLAIFKNWPVKMAFVDIAWGTFLYSWSSFITLFLYQRMFR